MIKDYKVGDTINNLTVYCVKKVVGTSSKGDNYFSLTLQDASGQLDAKVWDITAVDAFEAKDFINVTGTVQSFKDAPQLNITSAYKTDPTTVKIESYFKSIIELFKFFICFLYLFIFDEFFNK